MSAPSFALTDRVAIVTGGGRGIGKGIAIAFAEVGADVVVAARTVAEIEATVAEIRLLGRKALAIPTDVRQGDQVANMVNKTMEDFGRIDVLVNNAGGSFYKPFLELSEGGWDAIIKVNLKSVFLCTQAVGKIMVEQRRGSIVNIASMAGFGPDMLSPAYGVAKAGVINLTRTLGLDWGPYHVRVNAIAPGWVRGKGPTTTDERLQADEALRQQRISTIPLGRQGEPADIAAAAIFLASDASEWITGETLVMDGGPSPRRPLEFQLLRERLRAEE